MEQNVSQISGRTMINVDVSVKNIYVKKIMFGILVHVVVKTENIMGDDSIAICDEVIESYNEEVKITPANVNVSIFCMHFY